MGMNVIKDRNGRLTVWVCLILLAVLALLSQTGWLVPLERLSLDARFMLRGERPFTANIVVIGIDEASLDALGRWPWPRATHAAFLKLLRNDAFKPAAVSYDILFEQPDQSST